jgi:hypothetical protein
MRASNAAIGNAVVRLSRRLADLSRPGLRTPQLRWMAPFLYRCPNTGRQVRAWSADDPTEDDDDTFQTVTCIACAGLDLVNSKIGKVVGSDDE